MQRIRMYTARDIGRMTGTDPTTVHKWIDRGLLKGFRTPGGHRRVTARDLRAFLIAHGMPVPDDLREGPDVRVMMVDDDVAFVRNLARSIKRVRPGWEVEACGDAYQALLMIPDRAPSVLIVDVLMPGLDGPTLIKTVKAHVPTIHVFAAAGRIAAGIARKVEAAGAAGVLTKPLAVNQVLEAVERALHVLAPLQPANEEVSSPGARGAVPSVRARARPSPGHKHRVS